jgi:hypothetical protein
MVLRSFARCYIWHALGRRAAPSDTIRDFPFSLEVSRRLCHVLGKRSKSAAHDTLEKKFRLFVELCRYVLRNQRLPSIRPESCRSWPGARTRGSGRNCATPAPEPKAPPRLLFVTQILCAATLSEFTWTSLARGWLAAMPQRKATDSGGST